MLDPAFASAGSRTRFRFAFTFHPRTVVPLLLLCLFVSASATSSTAAPHVDPLLVSEINKAPLAQTAVVITYKSRPTATDLNNLRLIGINQGAVLQHLPMVLTGITQAQLNALKGRNEILSLYANEMHALHTNVSRTFIGVTKLRTDTELTTHNLGMPIYGKGVGVAIIDTGIDATHSDLQFGRTVVQNVWQPLTEPATIPLSCPGLVGLPGASLNLTLTGPVYVENLPYTDVEGGHGTFVAGVVAGSGQQSGGFYGGVAPGASIVGVQAGNDCGLPSFGILGAFDYVMANRTRYNIRVVNNSWGSRLVSNPYNPAHPINVATRLLHDNMVTVVFSAGNGINSVGDVPGALSPYCAAPWVVCVAASMKENLGDIATFSSRGEDNGTGTDVAGMPADPNAPPNLRPDITAPGVDIKSTRLKGAGVTNVAGSVPVFVGANDLWTISPAYLPFYTTSQGTSFSAPHVSGVVALMMEANPNLTPDDVVTILRTTATPTIYTEREVGAGYLDAHNAVRAAVGFSAVPHPANLIPTPDTPEILDSSGDQLGTAAQDIQQGDFTWDAAAQQLIFRLSITDLQDAAQQMRWTMQAVVHGRTIFVAANVVETGARTFQFGSIAPDPNTGTNTQTTLGTPDYGAIEGNQIVWKLGLEKLNLAAGQSVLGASATSTAAGAFIRIGSTLANSLLLSADSASGRGFDFSDPTPPPPPPPPPEQEYCERFSGALPASGSLDVPVTITQKYVDAKLNFHPGNQSVLFQIYNAEGALVGTGEASNGKRIKLANEPWGEYVYRLSTTSTAPLDFTINSCQAPTQ